MKAIEIKPLNDSAARHGLPPDRLTQALVWTAFFLTAALIALAADLWLWPTDEEPVAQAVGPTHSPAPLPSPPTRQVPEGPSSQPTMLPVTATVQATPGLLPSPTSITPPPCVPPDDWIIHVVVEGNTLFSLARRYGSDVNTLMRINCLNTHTIFIGQRLYVPGPLPTPTVPTAVPTWTGTPTPFLLPTATPIPATPTPVPTATPRSALQINIPDHYLNIVLLGSDRRPNSGTWRTDSMIVVSVDAEHNVVRLLSLPRDLWVYIPGHGYNRINTADLWGELNKKGSGPDWVKQTIHYNLGLPIHYYVRVDFQGFMKIIDTVGGVDVDVECPLPDINLAAGIQHMNGQEALRYARSRKSSNDFDRGRRQRKVLMALWDQALTLDLIPRLPDLWRTMGDTFQTDMPLDQVINLAYVGVQLKPQRILSQAIGAAQTQSWVTPEGAAVLLPRTEEVRKLLESFYAPVDTARLDASSGLRVRVLNGSPRRQADQLAAAALRWAGFKVVGTGPADRQDYAQTVIRVLTDNMAAGQQIARLLNLPLSAVQNLSEPQRQADPAQTVDVEVLLGRNYDPCSR